MVEILVVIFYVIVFKLYLKVELFNLISCFVERLVRIMDLVIKVLVNFFFVRK